MKKPERATPGSMRGGIRRPRGPHAGWSYSLYLGLQPAQRCPACTEAKRKPARWWIGAERLEACPVCGGELRETREPRQVTVGGFPTRRDAEIARARDVQRLGRGRYVPPERMTLAEFLRDRWLRAMDANGKLKATTREGYHRHVKYHLIGPSAKPHTIGLLELRKLNLEAIRQHYRELAAGYDAEKGGKIVHRPGLSVPSLRRIHATLHVALEYALELGMLDHNPASRAAKELGDGGERHRELPAWSRDELRAFLGSTEGDRDHALWRTIAMTGMRRGEALALRWGDVDLEGERLTVRRNRVPLHGGAITETTTKTNRVRVVDLDLETVEILRGVKRGRALVPLDDRDSYVFTTPSGEPENPHSVSYRFRVAVKASGQRAIPLHGLRHTHCTVLIEAGCPIPVVAARVGHANSNITMKVYAHCLPGAQKEALRALAL